MKTTPSLGLRSAAFVVAVLSGLLLTNTAHADDRRVILSIDMTPEGRKIAPATPAKPVYYSALFNGYEELGGIVKFYERKPASEDDIKKSLVDALARQGYLPATNVFPPSIVLAFRWGTIAPQRIRRVTSNVDVIHAYIVGDTWPDVNPYTSEGKEVLSLKARHFLVITAMDYQAFNHHKEVLLWRAHVSSGIWGSYLDQVIGTLIATAAPRLGHETKPGVVVTPFEPVGRVIVGQPQVTGAPIPSAKAK